MIQLKKFTTDWPNCPKCGGVLKISGTMQYVEPGMADLVDGDQLQVRCHCGHIVVQMPCADA